MLRPFNEIKNFALAARDGEIGKVKELYFDDQSWIVRYAVVDTGGWLTGRKVLIAPRSLGTIDQESKLIAVDLSRAQIEHSPPIEADKPVSRQFEEQWYRYFGYPAYWLAPDAAEFGAASAAAEAQVQAAREAERSARAASGDPHLRSTGEVSGDSIHATDGDIGRVDDFIVDDDGWVIRYLAISPSWWAGKKVLLAPEWIERISWEKMQVFVPLSRQAIREAPEWDDSQPITREFEQRLHDYYGRRGYWPVEV
ncbi:MAG: PRC-barrel domain-containing protein [Verrucomicrobiota bacterium]|nr:PRC-barrel domain-containing protein [Verrucomicrobiota bacterium]